MLGRHHRTWTGLDTGRLPHSLFPKIKQKKDIESRVSPRFSQPYPTWATSHKVAPSYSRPLVQFHGCPRQRDTDPASGGRHWAGNMHPDSSHCSPGLRTWLLTSTTHNHIKHHCILPQKVSLPCVMIPDLWKSPQPILLMPMLRTGLGSTSLVTQYEDDGATYHLHTKHHSHPVTSLTTPSHAQALSRPFTSANYSR